MDPEEVEDKVEDEVEDEVEDKVEDKMKKMEEMEKELFGDNKVYGRNSGKEEVSKVAEVKNNGRKGRKQVSGDD
jgi:hypothetical protein